MVVKIPKLNFDAGVFGEGKHEHPQALSHPHAQCEHERDANQDGQVGFDQFINGHGSDFKGLEQHCPWCCP